MKLIDIRKSPDGLQFDKVLDVKDQLLTRDETIIDLQNVMAKGLVTFDDGLYLLNYQLSYELTLPSSRSMEPVVLSEKQEVSEIFIVVADAPSKADLLEENLVLLLEEDYIDLSESVVDNILLNIPLKVLTDEEQKAEVMPEGSNWTVLTEEQYQAMKEEEKQDNSPFASLSGLFDED
ncbi:YceD family protein [Streptococcus pluranimalium]|uniref:YceD family protein n=1 Tax=Streptococcus pluranimalium TaxID=82348 RepID=UPI003F68CCAC